MAANYSSRERLRIFGSGVIRWTLLLSWLLLVFTPLGNAAERDGEKGGKPHGGTPFAIADFDGDNRLDLASVQAVRTVSSETQYLINFQLSSGRRQSVDVLAPAGGLRLTSRDVNGDEFPDVVVTTAWAERPVAVFLNDGFGNFTRSEPSAFPDAFEVPGSSLCQAADPNRNTAVAVSPRPPTGECDEYHPIHSPRPVIEYLATKYVPSSDRKDLGPFFGRAPPFLT